MSSDLCHRLPAAEGKPCRPQCCVVNFGTCQSALFLEERKTYLLVDYVQTLPVVRCFCSHNADVIISIVVTPSTCSLCFL